MHIVVPGQRNLMDYSLESLPLEPVQNELRYKIVEIMGKDVILNEFTSFIFRIGLRPID